MIKRLLSLIFQSNTLEPDRKKIEKFLSKSSDSYDLEQRIRELDKIGKYNQFYIS